MTFRALRVASLLGLPLLLAACGGPLVPVTQRCTADAECGSGRVCLAERCTIPGADAGADAGSDAGADAGSDAGADAGSDAGADAGADAGSDAGADAGSDAGADAGSDAGTPVGHLTLSPASDSLAAVAGSPTSTSFAVGNDGHAPLQFSISCTNGALPTPATGTIGADEEGSAVALSLPAWPSAGTQTVVCTVTTADGTGGPLTYTATVAVAPKPVGQLTLPVSAASTTLTVGQTGTSSFTLGNGGTAALSWSTACSAGATPTPASGSIAAGGTATVALALASFATAGDRQLTCTVTSADGLGGPLTFTLTVSVVAAPVGRLTLAPASAAVQLQVGQTGVESSFTLGNTGTASLDYAVACTLGATTVPASGALAASGSQAVRVLLPSWPDAGARSVVCTASTANGSGGPLTFTAAVTVVPVPVGKLTLTPATAALTVLINTANSTKFTLGNSGTATLTYGATCTLGASPSPASGTIAAGATKEISVNLPSFATAGARTVVCTADPTDTPDASLTFSATLNVNDGTAPTSPCGAKGAVWDDLNGLTGQALKDALTTRVSTGTSALSYSAAGTYVHDSNSIDKEGDGNIECVYSGERSPASSNGFNTEHTWPQSFFNEALPMKSDLHHLFPTDPTPNSQRGNYFFDNVTCTASTCPYVSTSTCGSAASCTAGGVSMRGVNTRGYNAYQVRQKQRGNTARALFYFAVRYPAQVNSSDSNCDAPSSPHCFPDWEQATMRQWHAQDPVDAAECARNDAIEALQHNRNPFVDRPDFLDKISSF